MKQTIKQRKLEKRPSQMKAKRDDSLAIPLDKNKHQRVKKYMFKKPAPLNSWGVEEHRSESWMELFIDLFYVAFLIKLGDIFYTCGFTQDSVLHVCAVFLGIYMSKFDFDQYMNKFEGEDLVHKVFFLIYALGNVIMILNVNETSEHAPKSDYDDHDDHDDHGIDFTSRFLATGSDRHVTCVAHQPYAFGYSLGWLITRGAILVMYCLIAHHVKPQGEYLLKSKSPILISSMLLISVNFFVKGGGDNYINSYITLAAGFLEFFGWMIWEVFIYGSCVMTNVGRQALIPVNIHHITSRTSTFIMLVLGEAVIALLTPTFKGVENHYFFAIFGVTIIFIFTFLYFDMQPRNHEPNALTLGRFSGVFWLALHPMLAFTMFGIGMSLKLLYADLKEHKDPNFSEQLLGGFLGVSVMLMTLIRSSHKIVFNKERTITFLVRMLLASLHIEVGYVKLISKNINVTIGLHIVICFLLIALDSWKYRHFEMAHPTPSDGNVKTSSVSNKPLARRGSVYAPQQSSTKGMNAAKGRRKELGRSDSMTRKTSMKRSTMFTQDPALLKKVSNDVQANEENETKRPFRNILRHSFSSGHESFSETKDPLSRPDLPRSSSLPSREVRIKEALEDFEKSRPHASITQVRRQSMFTSGSAIMRSASKELELRKEESTNEKEDIEMTASGIVPFKGESVHIHDTTSGNKVADDELNAEEYDVEYVCYVDEDGNVIEVDEEGNVLDGGGSVDGLECIPEFDDEIVEVVYDVDEDEFYDDYYDDEVEVIYEDPEPPKSHITWL